MCTYVEIRPSNDKVVLVTPDCLHLEQTEICFLSYENLKHFIQQKGMIIWQTMTFHIRNWSNHLVLITRKIAQLTFLRRFRNAFTWYWLHKRQSWFVSEQLQFLSVFFQSGFLLCHSHSYCVRSFRSTQNEIPWVTVSWKGRPKLFVRINIDVVYIFFVIRIFQTACNQRLLCLTFFITDRCLLRLSFTVTHIHLLYLSIIITIGNAFIISVRIVQWRYSINVRSTCIIVNIKIVDLSGNSLKL